jgi:hypothetical protein
LRQSSSNSGCSSYETSHKIDLLYRARWHLTSAFPFQILGLQTSCLLKLILACLLTATAMVAWLSMTSAPFGSLTVQSSSASTLGCSWIACDQVLGGWYFMSAVEMATVGVQVATLVVSQELSAHEDAVATEQELSVAAA